MYTGILTLFRAYFSICTFRRGPQDLPAAAALLLLSLCLYGLSSVAMVLPARALPAALLAGCVDTGLLLAITWVLLHLRGVPARFRQTGTALTLPSPTGGQQIFMVNGAPIVDGKGKSRGAVATFNDVTELEKKNRQLEETLKLLKDSRDEIEARNRQLQVLANSDPLTGCLNRRENP